MGKTGEVRSGKAGRHSCTVNGPEWGDCEIEDTDDSIEISPETVRSKGKRVVSSGRQGERAQEAISYKITLRFGEGNGLSLMGPIKLTILKNQVGKIFMAKVLKDGKLLIVCKSEEQRERARKIKK